MSRKSSEQGVENLTDRRSMGAHFPPLQGLRGSEEGEGLERFRRRAKKKAAFYEGR